MSAMHIAGWWLIGALMLSPFVVGCGIASKRADEQDEAAIKRILKK